MDEPRAHFTEDFLLSLTMIVNYSKNEISIKFELNSYTSVNWFRFSSGNGLLPAQCQTITWTNADVSSIGPWGTNFSEIQLKVQNFSFMKMHLKMLSAKWQPFCPGEMS